MLHANHLIVFDGRTEAARHERLPAKAGTRLDLDHYLEGLLCEPGALPGATALEQARPAGKFTPVHEGWWAAAELGIQRGLGNLHPFGIHRILQPLPHLVFGDVFDVAAHSPDISEEILDACPALPECLVGDRSDNPRAGSESTCNGCIRVDDEYPQQARHRGPVRVPVECQYHGVAYTDLTVADQSVFGCHPSEFLAVERQAD